LLITKESHEARIGQTMNSKIKKIFVFLAVFITLIVGFVTICNALSISSELNTNAVVTVVTIVLLIAVIVKKNPWVKVNRDFKDLANIVLLINDASAQISRLDSDKKIYQKINDLFTKSSDFDSVILLLSEDKTNLNVSYVSMASTIMNVVNAVFLKVKGYPVNEYSPQYQNVQIFNDIITNKSGVFFTRSELFRQAIGDMVSNLVHFMGESDNVGLPIIKNNEVMGIILITAPALAHEFLPAANKVL